MGSQYFYRIEATVKSFKTTDKSGMSNEMGGSPVNQTQITAVLANAQGQLGISWNPVADVQSYQVYRSTSLNGSYSLIATVMGQNTINYVDTDAERGTTYYYKVALVGTYAGSPVYGEPSPAVSGSLPAAQ